MRLISYDGGFGRIEGDQVIPMGSDIVEYLTTGAAHEGSPIRLDEVSLRAPVPKPGKIIAVGFNYRDHQAETGWKPASEPVLFGKYANSVIGPGNVIRVPRIASEPDYEAELAVVIGKPPQRLPLRTDFIMLPVTCAAMTFRRGI